MRSKEALKAMKPLKVCILLACIGIVGCSHTDQASSISVPVPSADAVPATVQLSSAQQALSDNHNSANEQISSAVKVINNVKTDHPMAALTFDDGPDDKYTPRILDILKKENVKGTFFVVGQQAKQHPQMMKRIVEEGHAVGNHSWDHPDLAKASPDKIQSEIMSTDDVIKQLTGAVPTLFRAPYGAVSPQLESEAEGSGHELIGWSVDTLDWDGKSVSQILTNVKKEVRPGSIILQHFAGGKKGNLNNTVEALPQIIAYLRQKGYTLVTVPELIAAKKS
ncbi:polysaccharide deacetylase family protein [Paenibacillus aestuarii]|uniref:Polysaccharide deacetylase family protein n=1 Tax=Paenibacillus aestuarii TaxID=516965 RepID=A0ABW0KI15_9BACL|nr:polysaccharide deacetylase family protein [Paenibacillus aestuarii]